MKKQLIAVLLITMLLSMLLTACYASKPGKMKDLVGTYELTSFTRSYSEEKDEEGNVVPRNLIEQRQITACYLVVGAEGEGYYVYEADGAEWVRKVKIEYTYSDKEPDKVKEIYYTDGSTTTGTNYPGKGTERLGLYFTRKEKTMSYTSPAIFGQKYSQSVKYTKVDKADDLSYVSGKLGKTLVAADYEVALLSGWQTYQGEYDEASPYIYCYIHLDMARKTADVYYALKSDAQPVELKNQAVTYTLDGQPSIRITVGQNHYQCDIVSALPTSLYYYDAEQQYWIYFGNVGAQYDVAEAVQTSLQNYSQNQ